MFTQDLYVLDYSIKVLGDDLKFVFGDDANKTFNVYIPEDEIKSFLDFADEIRIIDNIKDEETLRYAAQGIVDNYQKGGDYDIQLTPQKVVAYRFFRKEGGFHTIDKNHIGNPNMFLAKEPNYKSFKAILG